VVAAERLGHAAQQRGDVMGSDAAVEIVHHVE
jgi:hypothetical protein